MDYFAVIDTETNWNNEVMSIGVVIAEKDTFKKVDDLYFIFDPEYKIGGMFSMVLPVKGRAPKDLLFTRKIAMEKFKEAFEKYGVKDLFAYENCDNSITFIQYQAGAMGLNLQKSNKIVYFTPTLSSELFEQSKKRIHRIGQDRPCFYYQFKCGVEYKIYDTLSMRKDYTEYLFEDEG